MGVKFEGGGVVVEVSKFEGGRIRHFPALEFGFHRISYFFQSFLVFLLSFFKLLEGPPVRIDRGAKGPQFCLFCIVCPSPAPARAGANNTLPFMVHNTKITSCLGWGWAINISRVGEMQTRVGDRPPW